MGRKSKKPKLTVWEELIELHKRAKAELCLKPHPVTGYLCSQPGDMRHLHVCEIPPQMIGNLHGTE